MYDPLFVKGYGARGGGRKKGQDLEREREEGAQSSSEGQAPMGTKLWELASRPFQ